MVVVSTGAVEPTGVAVTVEYLTRASVSAASVQPTVICRYCEVPASTSATAPVMFVGAAGACKGGVPVSR